MSPPRWIPRDGDLLTSSTYLGCVTSGHVVPGRLKFAASIEPFFSSLVPTQSYAMPEYSIPASRKVFARFDQPAVCINRRAFSQATKFMYRFWSSYMTVLPWTHQEVIDSLDLTTSVGFPFNSTFSCKRDMFESCGTGFLEVCYEFFRQHPYRSIFDQSLKEEIRPVGKDPRGILCAPVDQVYISKRVFGAQTAGFYLSALETPSAVGMSREHLGWNQLFKYLNKHPLGISIDIKRFDSRMSSFVMDTIRDFRIACGADARLACAIYEQLNDTLVRLPDGSLYLKEGGNPSGSTTTTADNTQANFLANMTCLLIQFPDLTFDLFRENFAMFLYGDDMVCTSSFPVDWSRHLSLLRTNFGYDSTIEAMGPASDLCFLGGRFGVFHIGSFPVAVPIMDSLKMAHHLLFKNRNVSDERVIERLFAIRRLAPFNDDLMACVDLAIGFLAKHVPAPVYAKYHVSLDVARSLYLYPALTNQLN